MSGHVRRVRICVGPFSEKSAYCRVVFGEVGLVSGIVLEGRVNVGTCSAKST